MLRQVVWKVLGDKIRGKVDYYRFPEMKESWEGPFNGQLFRQKMFIELTQSIKFDYVIKTGNWCAPWGGCLVE